jgi:NTE family protein
LKAKSYLFILIILLALCNPAFSQERPKIGLVLSGGGASGLAHIGALKVIEKAGIPIDYIAGTSMGSIIGALYSIGFSADELESMVLQKDWDALMSDLIPRSDMSYESKVIQEKYFYSFPVNRSGIQLPSGLVAGNNIINMLAGLTLPAYRIRDFNELPIPYLCIGADIETGEEVVLNHGILHMALRASMAIPTYFTPVEMDGRLLIDGGFINNFPADHVKEMGADFIIGLDVQRELYSKDELTSLVNIMKQASSLTREEINRKNRELCDILIRPRTPGASVMSFGKAREIIDNGEQIAMEQWETLEGLGKNLAAMSSGNIESKTLPRIDSILINEVSVEGLENISPNYLLSKVNLEFPAYFTPDDISEGLLRAYGTNYFKKVIYHIDPTESGNRLIISAEEKNEDQANVGLHFDNLFNASLLLNANFRNLWKRGDMLRVDLTLGENPHIGATYHLLSYNNYNFMLGLEYNKLVAYEYVEGRRTGEYNYRDLILDLSNRTSFNNVFALYTGFQAELTTLAPKINILDFESFNSKMLNFYVRLNKDSFDRVSFPSKGEKVEVLTKLVSDFTPDGLYPAFIFNYRHAIALRLGQKLSLHLGLSGGLAFGDSIPYSYRSYMGGLGYYHKSIFPFVGMDYMERAANHSAIVRADFQYNVSGDHYISWRNNAGKSFNDYAEFKQYSSTFFGTGLTYGYDTPLGPIEGTIMISNSSMKPLFFINIGYWIK